MTDDELIAEMAEKAGPEWMRRLDMDDVMRAALAVARPVIEREALEKAEVSVRSRIEDLEAALRQAQAALTPFGKV